MSQATQSRAVLLAPLAVGAWYLLVAVVHDGVRLLRPEESWVLGAVAFLAGAGYVLFVPAGAILVQARHARSAPLVLSVGLAVSLCAAIYFGGPIAGFSFKHDLGYYLCALGAGLAWSLAFWALVPGNRTHRLTAGPGSRPAADKVSSRWPTQ